MSIRINLYNEVTGQLPSPFAGAGGLQVDSYANRFDNAPVSGQYRPVVHGMTYGAQVSGVPNSAYGTTNLSGITVPSSDLHIVHIANLMGTPSRLRANTPTYSAPSITWDYPTSGYDQYNAASFNVYRDNVLVDTTTTRSYVDTNLNQSGTYNYQIAAVNSQGTIGARSAAMSVEFHLAVPSAPGSVSATSPAKQPTLQWSAVTAATSYTVYRDGVSLATVTTATYTDTTASNGSHNYWIVSNNNAGSSAPSASVSAVTDTTRPTMAFTAPTSFTGPFNSGPVVSVTASDSSGLSTLVIHVYTSANQLLTTCGTATPAQLAAGAMSCDLASLADGSYYIKAGSFDNANNNRTIVSPTFTIAH
jgi:hypothetical protein